ncbi:unnamed protein product [Staurois parvus]|uniref:SET and MYND domain-containing protein 5 n=1 Tax=Staurois parvus TaxID=386267 RepID=A0ABN9E3D3_9NEOB|nr:unnamed protein product [Staurois parvus]
MAASMADMFWRCAVPEAAKRTVEIRHIGGGKGKGLFATRSIRKGETIFQERPLVSSQFQWNALYRYRACDHCLRSLETAEENAKRLSGNAHVNLPYPELCTIQNGLHQQCPDCQVSYCSAECLKAARDQYHQVLCLRSSRDNPAHPLNKLEEAWRNMHYPPETASSIMLMARMVATVKQAKDNLGTGGSNSSPSFAARQPTKRRRSSTSSWVTSSKVSWISCDVCSRRLCTRSE